MFDFIESPAATGHWRLFKPRLSNHCIALGLEKDLQALLQGPLGRFGAKVSIGRYSLGGSFQTDDNSQARSVRECSCV